MKLLLTSISIALATSTLAAAAPASSEPVGVEAPSAERLALARQFVTLTLSSNDYVELMHEGTTQMVAALSASFEDEAEVKSLEKSIKRYLAAAEPKVRAHMPKLAEAYAQVYARDYSAAELHQLIAFAQSPTGKRYLLARTKVDMDPLVSDAQEQLGEELAPLMEDMQREMCAEKAAQRIAAGDTKAKCPLSQPDTAQG